MSMLNFRGHVQQKKQTGSATVELALLLPVLIFLLVLIVDLGRMTYHYNVLLKGVRQAGRYLSTVTPGSTTPDPGPSGGSITTWKAAQNMVISYADSLCPNAATPCLTENMVKITDAAASNEGAAPLSDVSFGSGNISMVRIRIVGYSLPSVFAEYVKDWTGNASLFSPTVSATFPQL